RLSLATPYHSYERALERREGGSTPSWRPWPRQLSRCRLCAQRFVGIERERERLEDELAAVRARQVTSPGGLEPIVDELVPALAKAREVIDAGVPGEREAIVGSSFAVSGSTRRRATRRWRGSACRSFRM